MTLAAEAKRLKCKLLLVDEFIEKVFIPAAYRNGATIVGFNLPFDLSRIAMDYQRARAVVRRNGTVDRTMVGGFSFRAI